MKEMEENQSNVMSDYVSFLDENSSKVMSDDGGLFGFR